MDRKLRNRLLLFLVLAGVLAYILVNASGRQPVAKIAAVKPKRENLNAAITSNGKVEPIAPHALRAQIDTFVESVRAIEGQTVKKGQLLLTLDVNDAKAQLARARADLVRARDDLRTAQAGGRPEALAQINADLMKARAERDRLQKEHDALVRLVAQQAASRDELAKNEVALAKAQADVKRLETAKEEFDRRVSLEVESAALAVEQARSEIAAVPVSTRIASRPARFAPTTSAARLSPTTATRSQSLSSSRAISNTNDSGLPTTTAVTPLAVSTAARMAPVAGTGPSRVGTTASRPVAKRAAP